MKIKTLKLHGFKSFPDRTELELHEGITAIVGPNGCGKSNISDAIRWVLGEQRPTAIRGSRMEEAIFEGTAERKPIHRAEVEMVLNNEDGTLPVPYREVSIGRTVFRGGESEYRLNGDVCRLRDIQDLCRDTGLGANTYAIIENRMIDSILSDRAEERRAMFEEAAEIGRYKDRRRTALRRLEQARADLERLEDVLGEVRTKVRSLAQQRGRAERYEQYRDRKLRLEVAVSAARLEQLDRDLEEAEEDLEELQDRSPVDRAEISRRESEAETLRVEISEAETDRSRVASSLEEVRDRLEEIERRRLVADERASAAEDRLQAIDGELQELDPRIERLQDREESLEERVRNERARLEELRERQETLAGEVEERRELRDRKKEGERQAVKRHRELSRRVDALEASRLAAGERLESRQGEVASREDELESVRRRVASHETALEEAREALAEAREHRRELEARESQARGEVEARRSEVEQLRDRMSAVEGELSTTRERVEGLAALVGSGDEHPEVVRALLEEEPVDGVHGVLADHLTVEGDWARAVEAHLGPYLHGVLVRDTSAVRGVREWLQGREEEGLVLLPVDPGPRTPGGDTGRRAGDGDLFQRLEAGPPARAWVRALLSGVRAATGGAGAGGEDDGDGSPWAAPDGSGRDWLGAVRIGAPSSGRGVLRRRAELEASRRAVSQLEEERARLEEELSGAEDRLESARRRSREAGEALEEAGRAEGRAEAEVETEEHRLERARAEARELRERLEGLRDTLGEVSEEREADDERLEELREAVQEASQEASEARQELAEAEERWEEASGSLQRVELEVARAESEYQGCQERLDDVRSTRREAEERRDRLRQEREEKRRVVQEARSTSEEEADALEELFDRRDRLQQELREREEGLGEKRRELEERENWLRKARREERDLSERRHRLELRISELRAKRTSIRERVEQEWERPFEELVEEVEPPAEGGPARWSEELDEVRRRLARIGPVNLLAAQEYEEEKERLEFLEQQRDDLVEARDDLHDSIRRINQAAAEEFMTTFQEIRSHFQRTFASLFEGGECDVWLEDPEDPLDSPVEISASPRGKRTKRIHLLSGGERALTALALLFGIYLAKPSPFCIMDEVDAPLDETNIGRFTDMLERFKSETQFLVITHNPRTIAEADWIYGVTMQEPGVSAIVGVDLEDVPEVA